MKNEDIYRQLGRKFDLPTIMIKMIVESQYKFMLKEMKEGDCEFIHRHLGKFKMRTYKKKKDGE